MSRRIRKTRTLSDPFTRYVQEFRASPTAYAQAARAARLARRKVARGGPFNAKREG